MGVALAAHKSGTVEECNRAVHTAIARLGDTRPTAVNLFWALERMQRTLERIEASSLAEIQACLVAEANEILREDVHICETLGREGAPLIPDGARVLTHCNAGALATGNALAVLAEETRPYLQGARLTAWELQRDGIEVNVIADNMAGHLMSRGDVDCVIVGSDRTTANGDVANKIGTYTLAVLCRHHGIPFYAAVPMSTIDFSMTKGEQIPIEERGPEEVTHHGSERKVPEGVGVRNPAFDVTPADLVTAIITERGVARAPYVESLAALSKLDQRRGNKLIDP